MLYVQILNKTFAHACFSSNPFSLLSRCAFVLWGSVAFNWQICVRVCLCVWACGESHMFPPCSPACLLTWPLPWEQSDSGRLCTDVLRGFTEQVSERPMLQNTLLPSSRECSLCPNVSLALIGLGTCSRIYTDL